VFNIIGLIFNVKLVQRATSERNVCHDSNFMAPVLSTLKIKARGVL